jgi:probable HAF family extracellular repeat protein
LAPLHAGPYAHAVSGLPPAPSAVALGLATAKTYKFASADYPGAAGSLALDENASTLIGITQFTNVSGFSLKGGAYQLWVVPGGGVNEITGINTSGQVCGIYFDASQVEHGFIQTGNSVKNIDPPLSVGGNTTVWDINDKGVVVGSYEDSSMVTHGFSTKDGVSFVEIDYPGATATTATGINKKGDIVGYWIDSSMAIHGFLYSKTTFTSIDFPLAMDTYAYGINDSGVISGFFDDASFLDHGYIDTNGAFSQVDVAGAAGTELVRVKNTGAITGLYTDSNMEPHGLTGQ